MLRRSYAAGSAWAAALALLLCALHVTAEPQTDTDARAFLNQTEIPWKINEHQVARWKTLVGGDEGGQIDQPDVRFGLWELAPGAIYHLHVHDVPEIYYITAGRARWTVGDETQDIGPGTAVYTQPGAAHRMENLTDAPVSALWFWWAPNGDTSAFSGDYRFTEPAPEQPAGVGFPAEEVQRLYD